MAAGDEIAQAIDVEIQGIRMVFQGTVESVQLLMRMIRALINGGEHISSGIGGAINGKSGQHSYKNLQKLAEGGSLQVVNVREEDFLKIKELAKKVGLRWCQIPDFTPNDGKIPFSVLPQDMAAWNAVLHSVYADRLECDQTVSNGYDSQISECKEKLLHETDPEKVSALETQIEGLQQAKNEADNWVKEDKELLDSNGYYKSLEDYLMTAKGTKFETDPETAIAELEQGVELGAKIHAKDCFQPIRSSNCIPESKIMFYVPDIGAIVTRNFDVDKDTNLAFSNYQVKLSDGSEFTIGDKGITSEEWNKSFLPKLLDKAGIQEDTMCRAFDDLPKLKAYLMNYGKIKSPAEENVEKALNENAQVFSSAEAKGEILNAVSEQKKGAASAELPEGHQHSVAYSNVDLLHFMQDEGKLFISIDDDHKISFSGDLSKFLNVEKGSDSATIKFDESNKPTLIFVDGRGNSSEYPLTPEAALDVLSVGRKGGNHEQEISDILSKHKDAPSASASKSRS